MFMRDVMFAGSNTGVFEEAFIQEKCTTKHILRYKTACGNMDFI